METSDWCGEGLERSDLCRLDVIRTGLGQVVVRVDQVRLALDQSGQVRLGPDQRSSQVTETDLHVSDSTRPGQAKPNRAISVNGCEIDRSPFGRFLAPRCQE